MFEPCILLFSLRYMSCNVDWWKYCWRIGDLWRLEIVFSFTRVVFQIVFEIQLGEWYQCENCHRKKWKVIERWDHMFSRKPVCIAAMWRIQLQPHNGKLLCYREKRCVKSSQSPILHFVRNDFLNMWVEEKFCRVDERKKPTFSLLLCNLYFPPTEFVRIWCRFASDWC